MNLKKRGKVCIRLQLSWLNCNLRSVQRGDLVSKCSNLRYNLIIHSDSSALNSSVSVNFCASWFSFYVSFYSLSSESTAWLVELLFNFRKILSKNEILSLKSSSIKCSSCSTRGIGLIFMKNFSMSEGSSTFYIYSRIYSRYTKPPKTGTVSNVVTLTACSKMLSYSSKSRTALPGKFNRSSFA